MLPRNLPPIHGRAQFAACNYRTLNPQKTTIYAPEKSLIFNFMYNLQAITAIPYPLPYINSPKKTGIDDKHFRFPTPKASAKRFAREDQAEDSESQSSG
jgi:hypothetical protein